MPERTLHATERSIAEPPALERVAEVASDHIVTRLLETVRA
jgi:hypothetical protein